MLGTIIAIVISVLSGVASYVQARKAQKGGDNGFLVTKADNDAGLLVIYGERRVGGVKVFKDISSNAVVPASGRTVIGQNSTGVDATRDHWSSNRIWLDRVDVIGEGPIHSVTNVEVAGDAYTDARYGKNSLSHYRGIVMDGSDGQGWLSELGAKYYRWKSTSVGERVAYVQSRFRNHQDAITYQGEPDVQYQVKGKLIWDPRKDVNYGGTGSHLLATESTWEWSDNPSLCLLDYLLADYGRGLDIADIDVPSFIVAANSCDTLVAVPPVLTNTTGASITAYNYITGEEIEIPAGADLPNYRDDQSGLNQKRLRCNAIIDPKDKVVDNVKKLLETMKGNLPYHQGKYSLKLEDAASSVMSFDTTDIIGGITFGEGDQSERFNRVTVKFPNRSKRYQMDQVSWPSLDSAQYAIYLAEDNNNQLWHEVDLTGVSDFYQAEDLAEFIVRNSRASLQCEIKVKSKAIMLQPADVVTITHATPGWTAKKFRVRGVKVAPDFSCSLNLTEYQDSVYQWSTKANEPDSPDVGLASIYDDLTALTGLTGTVARVDSADGVPHGLVTLTWDAVDDFEVAEYVLRYKQQSETVFQTTRYAEVVRAEGENPSVSFTAPQNDTTYDVYLHYTVTSSGRTSDVVTTTIVIPEYRTDLDVFMNDIELESGLALTNEAGDLLVRSDLSDLAVYYRASEIILDTKINTQVNSLDADIASLQELLQDVTAGTADVYLQDEAPVAGVGGIPDPIVGNSRWYDTNDNNKAHVWDGTAWQSLVDPRIGVNESDIVALEAATTDPVTGLAANAGAISLLDATVVTLDGTVTSIAADVVELEASIADPTTGLVANADAAAALQVLVTANDDAITTSAQDIVDLRVDLTAAEGLAAGNAGALSALDARIELNEEALLTVAAFDIVNLEADLAFRTELVGESGDSLQTDETTPLDLELENDLSAMVAGSSLATRALTVRVEQTETGLISQSQDIVTLQSSITDNELGLTAQSNATTALTTRVATNEGSIISQSQALTTLSNDLSTTDGNVAANTGATDDLTIRVSNTEGVTTAQGQSISALEATVNNATTGVTATAEALDAVEIAITDSVTGLTASANAIEALQLIVNNASTGVAATADAVESVELAIADTETGLAASAEAIDALQLIVNNATTGVAATADAVESVELAIADTETGLVASAEAIDALQLTVNNASTGVAATADAVEAVELAIADTETGLAASANAIEALELTVNNATTGVAATANAVEAVELAIDDTETGLTASADAIEALQLTVNNATTGVAATADALDTVELAISDTSTGLSASAQKIGALETTVTDPTTGLTARVTATEAFETRIESTEDGIVDLSAEYNVRLDVNGYVSGFGLVNAGTSSTFGIRADKFLMTDSGGAGASPFSVSGGVVTMQNVVIDGALVSGTIKTAASGYRVEVSQTGDFPIWYGTGTKNAANGLFYVDATGQVYVNGVINAAAGSTFITFDASVSFTISSTAASNTPVSHTTSASDLTFTYTNGSGNYSYVWSNKSTLSGSAASVSNSTSEKPTFTANVAVGTDHTSVWEVVITDTDTSATTKETVFITMTNIGSIGGGGGL